jgi:hypothetical protein
LLAFFGIGFALDRWLGTTPVLMIVFSVLAAVGLFYAWKARYTAQMEALEAQRGAGTGASERAPASERPEAAQVVSGMAGERKR